MGFLKRFQKTVGKSHRFKNPIQNGNPIFKKNWYQNTLATEEIGIGSIIGFSESVFLPIIDKDLAITSIRLKMNSNDDDLEIIDLEPKASLVKQENSFDEVLILSDDEQQTPPVPSATIIPKKEKLKLEDVVIDWSIFKNTAEPKSVTPRVKVESAAIDGDSNDFFQKNIQSGEGRNPYSAFAGMEKIKSKPNLWGIHPERNPELLIDDVKPSIIKTEKNVIDSGDKCNAVINCDLDEVALDDDNDTNYSQNVKMKPKLFDIEVEENVDVELEMMNHFTALRDTFRKNHGHYEMFLRKVIFSLCGLKNFVNDRSVSFEPSTVIDIFLNDTKKKPDDVFTTEIKPEASDNPIVEKFISKLKILNKHKGNKIEEFIEKTKILHKLKNDCLLMLNNILKEEGLLRYIVSDIEECDSNLSLTDKKLVTFVVAELKSFIENLHYNFENVFGDLISTPDDKNDNFDQIHEDQFLEIFEKSCELLEKNYGNITQIYHCAENGQYLFSFERVEKMIKVNFSELLTQDTKHEMDEFEKIFNLKKSGKFFIDNKNKRTIYLNKTNHQRLNEEHDQIIVSSRDCGDLDIFYATKKTPKNVTLDLTEFFKYFMRKIFSNLYHFSKFQCLSKADENPKKFLDKNRDVFDLDRFLDDEIAWLSIVVFCVSKHLFGSEYFEKEDCKDNLKLSNLK